VVFHDRFVSLPELLQFLSAADIYVTPYLKASRYLWHSRVCSCAGKAVISTPYNYAKELLADGRGALVGGGLCRDRARGDLDPARREPRTTMQARAAEYGAGMTWSVVATKAMQSFERAKADHQTRSRAAARARTLAQRPVELPPMKLEHLRTMTDDTGLLQHATFNVPRYRDGYCTTTTRGRCSSRRSWRTRTAPHRRSLLWACATWRS